MADRSVYGGYETERLDLARWPGWVATVKGSGMKGVANLERLGLRCTHWPRPFLCCRCLHLDDIPVLGSLSRFGPFVLSPARQLILSAHLDDGVLLGDLRVSVAGDLRGLDGPADLLPPGDVGAAQGVRPGKSQPSASAALFRACRTPESRIGRGKAQSSGARCSSA